MFTKWFKNFRWMNTRVGKAFFEEKMANLRVFFAKVCEINISSTARHPRKQLRGGPLDILGGGVSDPKKKFIQGIELEKKIPASA